MNSIDLLEDFLTDEDLKVRQYAAVKLAGMGLYSVTIQNVFIEVLTKNFLREDEAELVFGVLGKKADVSGIRFLSDLLFTENFHYEDYCFLAIVGSEKAEAVEHLLKRQDLIQNRLYQELLTIYNFPTVNNFKVTNFLKEYISHNGHNIHKLKAKDTTGRWAYYFVLVRPFKEKAFLKAIDGGDTIDLEDYGKVVASCYGESPTQEVKDFLKEKYDLNV